MKRGLLIGRGKGDRFVHVIYVIDPDGTVFVIHARPLTEVAEFDKGVDLSQWRPLTPSERKLWQKAKRKMGRPKVGEGAKIVPISIERGL